MIKAVIFDMDGVLLDSEPVWREAEIEAFAQVGLHLEAETLKTTLGLRIDEAVAFWYRKHPWTGTSVEAVTENIGKIFKQKLAHVPPMPGIPQLIGFFRDKGLPIGLASSSPPDIIEAVVEQLDLTPYFTAMQSGEDEAYGKPHPAVFLTTAQKLGVPPTQCLVFEDSFNGLLAAKAARTKTVVVPDPAARSDPRWAIADFQLDDFHAFTPKIWSQLNS